MITIDLITGFLGAGKTTFIRKWLQEAAMQTATNAVSKQN